MTKGDSEADEEALPRNALEADRAGDESRYEYGHRGQRPGREQLADDDLRPRHRLREEVHGGAVLDLRAESRCSVDEGEKRQEDRDDEPVEQNLGDPLLLVRVLASDPVDEREQDG